MVTSWSRGATAVLIAGIVVVALGAWILFASPSGAPAAPPVAAAPDGGGACSPAVRINSFTDALDKTTLDGAEVAGLSALAVLADGRLATVSDRSVLFTLDGPAAIEQVPLLDESGQAIDAEGLVVDADGGYLVTSEVEPSVRGYAADGGLRGSLVVPDSLRTQPGGRAAENVSFEGLTLQPGGRTLVASMEGALAGDAADVVRFQTWDRDDSSVGFQPAAQFAYRTDGGLGVAEIAATGDGRLLVLERGFVEGTGNTVRLYLANLAGATDTSTVDLVTGPGDVRPISKTLLADLQDCPTLGATARQPQPNPLLDNIEGMAVTGSVDGALDVVLVSDDNQNPAQITRFYSITVRLL
jgi:hypothetical protein